jgi:hypothetical protein
MNTAFCSVTLPLTCDTAASVAVMMSSLPPPPPPLLPAMPSSCLYAESAELLAENSTVASAGNLDRITGFVT